MFFISSMHHPFTFSFLEPFHFFLSWGHTFICHQLRYLFCMASAYTEPPSTFLRSRISSNFSPSSHCISTWFSFVPTHNFLFLLLFIFDLRAIPILLDTLPKCSVFCWLGFFMRACLLLDARNHLLSDFMLDLPLSAVRLFLPASFLCVSSWQPASTVARQRLTHLLLISFLHLLVSLNHKRHRFHLHL